MDNYLQQVSDTFEQIGVTIYSDELCCQVLAYVFVYGGGNEQVVYNTAFNQVIRIAQKKANIFGSEIPNIEYVALIQKYIKELKISEPKWLLSLEKRYNLKTYK